MARVVVIGGSGHVGTYLVPRLVAAGHQVVNVSRGARVPYAPHAAWGRVETVSLDRDRGDAEGSFGPAIAALKPDVVIDMICFTEASARQMVAALRGNVAHYLCCCTIWVHGPAVAVPTTEDAPRTPFGSYGTQKAAIEAYLLDEARRGGFPATVVHPGHIVGPGWRPINPAGHLNPAVFTTLARGEELVLPNFGLETLHHVHADDVAQVFQRAMERWGASVGEAFHAVSPQALTLRGFAEGAAGFFGQDARLAFRPFEAWKAGVAEDEATATWEHISRSPSCSIDKARRLLGYEPRYSSLAAVKEAVGWLVADGQVQT
jgi:nucleoside-diphosphate-sugar epimerase